MEASSGLVGVSPALDPSLLADLYPRLVTDDMREEEEGEKVPDNGAVKWMESLSLLEQNLDSDKHVELAEQVFHAKQKDSILLRFSVTRKTGYGNCAFVAGSVPELGQWDVAGASGIKMNWHSGDVWTMDVEVSFREKPLIFEYKYYASHNSGKSSDIRWEEGLNHVVLVNGPPRRGGVVELKDDWGSPAATKIQDGEVTKFSRTKNQGLPAFLEILRNPFQDKTVVFRLHVNTSFGDKVYVSGNVPELGDWKRDKAYKLNYVKQGEGNESVWEASVQLPVDRVQFEYKYLVQKRDGTKIWEKRVSADKQGGGNRQAMTWMNKKVEKYSIIFEDKFEHIKVQFSIFYPAGEDEIMNVTGDPRQIGKWAEPGPVPMELGEKEKLETDVEGQKWELSVFLPPDLINWQYRYVLMNTKTGFSKWEREPNRVAKLDTMVPVNSTYMLKDVNFVSEMQFDACPPDMFIGPYPQTKEDVDLLAEAGVTAVLNVQTDEDFQARQIDWNALMKRYEQKDIEVVRYQIRDFDRNSLRERLMKAVRVLDSFHMNGKKSYIHCTAGMGRAPAVVVAYLVWVKKWQLHEAVHHVKQYRKVAVPNVPVLEEALRSHYTLY